MSELGQPSFSFETPDCGGSAVRLLIDLLNLDGVSCREGRVSAFIRQHLLAAGLSPQNIVDDAANDRLGAGDCGNLVVNLPGRGDRARLPRILLSAHMDTVPLCLDCRVKLDPTRRILHSDGKTALGADNRSGCAALLHTALRLLRDKHSHRPLTLVFFVQEEIGLRGSRVLDRALLRSPQFGINVDGGAPERVYLGGIGASDWRATVRGVPAHAAVHPEDGVSAVAVTALALASLHRGGWHGRIDAGDIQGTANVGAIRGGSAANVVADVVEISGEARSHNQESLDAILRAIEDAFLSACGEIESRAGDQATAEVSFHHRYHPFSLPPTTPGARAVADILPAPPSFEISNGGVDANNLNNLHHVPTVTIGAGAHDLHTVNETCSIDEFNRCCNLLYRLSRGQSPTKMLSRARV